VKKDGTPDFLVIGHVTLDIVKGGSAPGGAAFYASLAAVRLGRRVGLVTRGAPQGALTALEGVEVVNLPSETATVFENIYKDGKRAQRIHSVAGHIDGGDVPKAWGGCPVQLIAPVYREVKASLPIGASDSLVGICPQGWMRERLPDGRVKPVEWDGGDILRCSHVMALSEEDLVERVLPKTWHEWPGILIITKGEQGSVGRWDGRWHRVPAYAAREVSPTGAGDVFAAAFLVRYSETRDPAESALFAAAAASVKVEHAGVGGIPTRERVQERRARHPDLRVTPCEKPF